MPRFAFTFFLILLVVGCQTSNRGPQKTVLVNSSQPATPAKAFWLRTAQLLQPLMPDRGHRAGMHTTETGSHFASERLHSDILPINHSTHSLYRPGSIFPSPALVHQNQPANVSVAETAESPDPLRIQSGDSEAFKSLLREIAIMPPEKRQVDDARLATLLTTFREGIMDSDVEAEFIALLRKQILPESKPMAPLPSAILDGRRQMADDSRSRESNWDDDFPYDEPMVRQVARKAPPSNDEPVVAQRSMSMAGAMTGPVYPSLSQLPGAVPTAVPAVVQAGYQSQSVVPTTPNFSSHGAGDWRAPVRAAVEQLRYAIEQTPNGRTTSNEMRLRMLEMLLDNKTEAVRPMQSADKTLNEFLGHQVLGWTDLLDESMQNSRSRYVSAVYRFGEGLTELQNLCPIKLKNVMFIEDWIAFGQYVPRNTQEFYPGDKFLVYMEIDNPTVRRIPDGFEVGVSLSYEIRDAHAAIVDRRELGPSGERSLSRKRDYALAVPGTLPPSLAPGQYHLRINVTDLNDDSMQYAEEQIPFRVAPSLATGR